MINSEEEEVDDRERSQVANLIQSNTGSKTKDNQHEVVELNIDVGQGQ